MRIIFHIGMGKTGTSSIQNSLLQNSAKLAKQNAAYLGMWFDSIDPSFKGVERQKDFFSSSAKQMEGLAGRFATALSKRAKKEGIDTFILSNESLFGNVVNISPFLDALRKEMPVSVIAYMRNPSSWLPAAFTQWGIRHKHQSGPILPYGIRARELINQYEGIRVWVEKYREILTVRPYEKSTDVVLDFSEATGIEIVPNAKRSLERAEPADILLRALYNNRFPDPILPDRFNAVVFNANRGPAPSVREMADLCFRHEGTSKIIAEKRELFEFIHDNLGFDFLADTSSTSSPPDEAELQHRLIDYLTEITLNQAVRLKRLERLVNELRDPS